MRDSRPAYMKLENPSLGARKESILTDEMMIAFCESRLDWIAKDMEELFDDRHCWTNDLSTMENTIVAKAELALEFVPT